VDDAPVSPSHGHTHADGVSCHGAGGDDGGSGGGGRLHDDGDGDSVFFCGSGAAAASRVGIVMQLVEKPV